MRNLLIYLSCLGLLAGCSKPEPAATVLEKIEPIIEFAEPVAVSRNVDFSAVSSQVESRAMQVLSDTLRTCTSLQNQVYRFLSNPSQVTQEQTQNLYRQCHQQWHSAAFYLQLPMQLGEQQAIANLNDLIDTRPFQLGYIDSIPGYPDSGLIFDIEIALNEENLRAQHRLMDEESASLGFPVVEYFLWKAPVEDYWLPKSNTAEQNIINRRLTFLKVATDHLINQINTANQYWQNAAYQQLPQRVQRNLLVQSLQRQYMVRLLNAYFADDTLADPHWRHPSLLAGEGRNYVINSLKEIEYLLTEMDQQNSPFAVWLDQLPIELSAQQLREAVTLASQQFAALPGNYPIDAESNDQWLEAQQSAAQLAMYFTQLARYFDLGVITQ